MQWQFLHVIVTYKAQVHHHAVVVSLQFRCSTVSVGCTIDLFIISLQVQVSTGISYGELGPHIPPAAITPPAIDNNVWYTSLLHQSEQSALNPAGMYMYVHMYVRMCLCKKRLYTSVIHQCQFFLSMF